MIKARFVAILEDGTERTMIEFDDYTLEANSEIIPVFGAPQEDTNVTIRGRGRFA